MANTQDVDMASEHPGPSRFDAGEETDVDVEIVDEGEEGETTGPVPAVVKGQSDLEPATYRIGRSSVTEAVLDEYVESGLFKALLHSLCHAPSHEEVP